MLQKQHVFSAIILVLALALAGVTWSLISGTLVEIGFSKKKMVTQKRLRRRLRKEPFWPRFSLSIFLREADQKRWAVWAGRFGGGLPCWLHWQKPPLQSVDSCCPPFSVPESLRRGWLRRYGWRLRPLRLIPLWIPHIGRTRGTVTLNAA